MNILVIFLGHICFISSFSRLIVLLSSGMFRLERNVRPNALRVSFKKIFEIMIFCIYTLIIGIGLFFSGTPRTLMLMCFFQLRYFHFCSIFSFIGIFIILIRLLSSTLNIIFFFLSFFSWLLSFVFSTDLLGVEWSFLLFQRVESVIMWFNSVLFTPSQLMLQLVGISPGLSKIFSHYLVPKPAFTFLCLQIYFMRNLKKIKFIKKKLIRLPLPCRISHHVNLEVI